MWKCPAKTRSTSCNDSHRRFGQHRSVVFLGRWFVLFNALFYPHLLFATQPGSTEEPLPWYGYLYIGDNMGSSNSGDLTSSNYKSGGPPEWGIGIGRYFNETFSLEGTFEYWGERYERSGALVAGTENNVIQAGGLGLSATATYNYHQQNFHAYLGAGAGYFITGILVTEPGSGLLTDKGAPSDKWLPGYHVTVGADYRIEAGHRLGIELKHRILKADFGEYTGGEADVGGTYLLLMYRHDSR